MAVKVYLVDSGTITHRSAHKWIADPVGNLVILQPSPVRNEGPKATHIYAANSWAKAEVVA